MKAGILTLQEADNYGAVLQAYALQTALANLNVESEFIIFEEDKQGEKNISEELDKLFIPLARRIQEEGEKRSAFFSEFRKTYLQCSVPIPRKNVSELNTIFDVFIAGSDQVWNFSIPEVDGRYFLPFVNPEKRFSYAASFGGDSIPAKAREWCVKQLREFHALSVREESGRKILKELTGRDSVVCLDPVFLLNRTDWEKILLRIEEKPYILLHLVQYNKDAVAYVKNLASEKGLQVRVVTAGFMYPCGFQPWSGTDVVTWLSLIKNAEYVFTNSFHGMAFSMIFSRPFYIIELKKCLSDRNIRMTEFLKKMGMEKCMNGEIVTISTEELEVHLGEMKQISYDYLKKVTSI